MTAFRTTTNDEIRKLHLESRSLNQRYSEMNAELVRVQSELEAKANFIRVERVPGVEKLTTVFEPDPNIVERNRHLAEELEIALVRKNSDLASRPEL